MEHSPHLTIFRPTRFCITTFFVEYRERVRWKGASLPQRVTTLRGHASPMRITGPLPGFLPYWFCYFSSAADRKAFHHLSDNTDYCSYHIHLSRHSTFGNICKHSLKIIAIMMYSIPYRNYVRLVHLGSTRHRAST